VDPEVPGQIIAAAVARVLIEVAGRAQSGFPQRLNIPLTAAGTLRATREATSKARVRDRAEETAAGEMSTV